MRKITLWMMLVIGLFGISGCSSDKHISKDEAKEEALKEVNGDVTGYGQDLDDDTPYYEFDIVKESKRYEIKVHSKTGAILSKEVDETYKADKATDNDHANTVPAVSQEEAKKIALEKVGGGTVIKCELDDDSYRQTNTVTQVYEIEIQYNAKEYDLSVDANTKEILEFEVSIID